MNDQLILKFPSHQAYKKEDFYVSPSNQKAYDFINSWPKWIKRTINIFGPSGSGKSTLLNLIAGIDLPDQGEVRIDGKSLGQMSEKNRTLLRRRTMGFVFQSFNLIPTLNVYENLMLPLELNQISKNSGIISQMLEALGLEGREESYPDRLSGGEQQRIAIARALMHQPSLLLADEPTGNLDEETSQETLKLINHLVHRSRTTMIMATHSQEVICLLYTSPSPRDQRGSGMAWWS